VIHIIKKLNNIQIVSKYGDQHAAATPSKKQQAVTTA
jgi:hypothetical protein